MGRWLGDNFVSPPHGFDPNVKPPAPVLNGSHPLAANLIGAWLFNEGSGGSVEDLSTRNNNMTLVNVDPGDWVQDATGWRVDFDGASELAQSAADIFNNADLASGSVFLVGSLPPGAAVNRFLFSIEGFVNILMRTGGVLGGHSDGSGTDKVVGATPVNNSTRFDALLTWATNTRINLYLNGVADSAQGTPSAAPNVEATAGRATAIAANFGAASHIAMSAYTCYVFNKELSAAEAAELHADPWAMFR